MRLRLGVYGLGFGGLGFGVWGLRSGVWGLQFRVLGLGRVADCATDHFDLYIT